MPVTRINGRTPPHGVSQDPAVVVAATEVRGGGKEGASPARSVPPTSPSTSTRSSGRRRDPRLPRLPLGRGCPPEMGSSAHKEVVGLPNKLRLALSPPSKDNKPVDDVLVGVDLRIELFVPSSRSADSGTVPGGGRPRRGRSCRQLHLQPIHRCTSSWTGVPNLLPGIDFH